MGQYQMRKYIDIMLIKFPFKMFNEITRSTFLAMNLKNLILTSSSNYRNNTTIVKDSKGLVHSHPPFIRFLVCSSAGIGVVSIKLHYIAAPATRVNCRPA